MSIKKKRIGVILLIVVLICSFVSVVGADESAVTTPAIRVVKVGLPIQGALAQKDKNGEYGGYTYEYLQEIAQYTGWEYQFVDVPGDSTEELLSMMDMLEKGELDILTGMSKNEATMALFDFPEHGYGYSYTTISVLESNSSINEGNYLSIEGLKVGVYEGAEVTNGKLDAYCKLNSIDYIPVGFATSAELIQALAEGKVDAAISNDMMPLSGCRPIAQFASTPFYFGVTKGNSEIASELDRAIMAINQVRSDFEISLYNKYFSYHPSKIYFSDSEKQFLKTMKTMRVVTPGNLEPIGFYNKKDETVGIAREVLDMVSEKTGITMEHITANSFSDALQMVKNGEADAVCGIPYDYELAQEYHLMMSNSFLSDQMVLVMSDESAEDQDAKVGIVDGMSYVDNYDIEVVKYNTPEECLEAVVSNEVGHAYMNLYTAEALRHHRKYDKLRLVPQTANAVRFCMGLAKPSHTELLSIINKAVASITVAERDAIVIRNTIGKPEDITLSDFVKENPFAAIMLLSGVFVVVLGAVVVVCILRIKTNRSLLLEGQRALKLSELANEYFYEYDFQNDIFTFSKSFTQMFPVADTVFGASKILADVNKTVDTGKEDFSAVLKDILLSTDNGESKHLCETRNGQKRWYRSTWGQILGDDGTRRYVIGKLVDVQAEIEEKERIEQRLLLDGMTGVYNAVSAKALIEKRLHELEHTGALLIIDIDEFKLVNDVLGHYLGDVALKDFATLLNRRMGSSDIVGRLGGDEFVIFIDAIENMRKLDDFCEELCQKARREYKNDEGAARTISISIGGALVRNKCDFTHLYQAVDKRLYLSKADGRNRYTLLEY